MEFTIQTYNAHRDQQAIMALIESEGDEWRDYLNPGYQEALKTSVTYVAYANDTLCGYSRSITDHGLYIWVIDLLVHRSFRGHAMGKALLTCLLDNYPGQRVFVLSDVDAYYEKIGYKKEGSIFEVT